MRGVATVAVPVMLKFGTTKRQHKRAKMKNSENNNKEVVQVDDSEESSGNEAFETHALYSCTDHDIKIIEALDAELEGRPLANYEKAAGLYPGYSKPIRIAHEYRKQHPEVSAVAHARVARIGEDDNEQTL